MGSKKENIWNIANLITLLRLLLGIPIFYLVCAGERSLGIVLYVIFLAMDFADGKVAKALNCRTTFGQNFDIFADGVVGIGLLAILILDGTITRTFMIASAVPVLLAVIGFAWGVAIAKNTFIPSKWRKLNGAAYFMIILAFLINHPYAIAAAYVLIAYYYVSWTKYLFEIWKAARQ